MTKESSIACISHALYLCISLQSSRLLHNWPFWKSFLKLRCASVSECAGPGCLWSSTFMLSSVLKEHIDSSSQVCFTFPDSFQKRTPLPIDFLPFLYFLFSTFIFYFFQIVQSDPKPFYFRTKALVFVNQILQRYFSKCLVPWKENSTGMKNYLSVILGPRNT